MSYYLQPVCTIPPVPYSYSVPHVIVYTDGCCIGNGTPNARAGIGGYFGPNSSWNFSERVVGKQTNNAAEILAAVRAIQLIKSWGHGQIIITIRTDSKFLVDSYNDWIPKWQSNGWKDSNGKPVKNRAEFEQLIQQITEGVRVIMEHVLAHQGDHGNEAADQLAKAGASKNL